MKIRVLACDGIATKATWQLFGLALLTLFAGTASAAIGIDVTLSTNRSSASTTIASPPISTASGNELLLAFIATDSATGQSMTVTRISAGTLTWTLVRRTNTQKGTAEIWRAFTVSPLSSVTVTATLSQSVAASMTVISFTGVDASGTNGSGVIGATGGNSGSSLAPSASLVTTRANSWVFGVGNDYDRAVARTIGPGQTMINQYLATVGDTYWVQRQTNPTPLSGTSVTINDTAPTGDKYNLSIVEILAPSAVAVPNVVGATQAAATTTLTNAGLKLGTVTSAFSTTVAAGLIISQNPGGGTIVSSGSSLAIVVSLGVAVTVPSVVGSTQTAATTTLTTAGLVVGTVTNSPSTTVASGSVISQNPAGGTLVASGSAVNLVVSSGPPLVTVPSVVGTTQASATTTLTTAGLTVGTVTTASSSTVASGSVISQNPAGGTQVVGGTAVSLVVSTGPVLVTVPSVVSETQAAATTDLTNAGLTVGTVTTASSTTVTSGSVISQNPTSGTQVAAGSAVALVISSGPPVTVPSVVNETQAAATTDLTSAGLTVGAVTTSPSATVPSGSVISQNPAGGAQVATGSAVALVISSGSAVTVPSVLGATQTAAAITLTKVNLALGSVTTTSSSTVAFGLVISQNPTSTTQVAPGSAVDLVVSSGPSSLLYPDLQDIIPTTALSIITSGGSKQFIYTHDTLNAGPGPLVIQPVYNASSGTYQGTQYIYTHSGSTWSISQQVRVPGAFIFDSAHGHFHFPFTSYGLYADANGAPGAAVAISGKTSFCINDSFIYLTSIPNAGAIGNLGSCNDPTSLRGLNIGAVDEYDQTDPGQSIAIDGVPNGTYWLRATVDPDNYFLEPDKTNNETDVQFTISNSSVTVLKSVVPVLPAPPGISVTAPTEGTQVSGVVQLTATTAQTTGVQFLVDGQAFGGVVTGTAFSIPWDTTTFANGSHWLSAQTTGPTGRIGSAPVVAVTVANSTANPPTVNITAPTAGSTVSATVTLSATATSGLGIASVTFYADGAQVGTPVLSPPFITTWDTQTFTAGQHVLIATAIDTTGNSANSAPISVTVDNSHPPNVITQDVMVSVDGSGTMTTPTFNTSVDFDLLVAFVAYDGPSTPQTATVSGGGLNWTLAKRSNSQGGTSEIWTAPAGEAKTLTVTSQPGSGGSYQGSLTVVGFINASGPGIVGQASAPSGAPDIFLPGVSAGNWVFAVGNDYDRAIARTPVTGQVLVHQRVDTQTGDTYWVQSTTAPSTANALVDIHDSSPTTDQWNYAAVEIVATRQ